MKTIKSTCTDAELSAAVAEHVAGCTKGPLGWQSSDGNYFETELPPFATSADAVLPLLEKWRVKCTRGIAHWTVRIVDDDLSELAVAVDDSLTRAACFALLKAKGWTVEEAT